MTCHLAYLIIKCKFRNFTTLKAWHVTVTTSFNIYDDEDQGVRNPTIVIESNH